MFVLKGKRNRVKENKWKNNFVTDVLFTNLSATLPGDPASKKRHNYNGRVAPPNIVAFPKVLKL